METIIIKKLESSMTSKGANLKVHYNGNKTASVAPWLKDEIAYIENIGVGGLVAVEIKCDGQYSNIVNVDFTSGKKSGPKVINANGVVSDMDPVEKETVQEAKKTIQENFDGAICMSQKDEFILAQVILKGAVELSKGIVADGGNIGEHMTAAIDELVGSFKYALTSVKAL